MPSADPYSSHRVRAEGPHVRSRARSLPRPRRSARRPAAMRVLPPELCLQRRVLSLGRATQISAWRWRTASWTSPARPCLPARGTTQAGTARVSLTVADGVSTLEVTSNGLGRRVRPAWILGIAAITHLAGLPRRVASWRQRAALGGSGRAAPIGAWLRQVSGPRRVPAVRQERPRRCARRSRCRVRTRPTG